jgi:hypothetical protein
VAWSVSASVQRLRVKGDSGLGFPLIDHVSRMENHLDQTQVDLLVVFRTRLRVAQNWPRVGG